MKNIIITGGELFNKGAQSMTFMTVDKMKQKYPDAEIIVLSTKDYERSSKEKEEYDFKILPFTTGWVYELSGGVTNALWKVKNTIKTSSYKKYEVEKEELKKILEHTIYMIDVSGFAFSSQFSTNRSVDFLLRIYLAKKFNIPVVIMPQSYGPFDFKGKDKLIINQLAKRTLSYPEVIYTRENEGHKMMEETFGLKNLKRSTDMVLLNKSIDYSNVYANDLDHLKSFNIEKGVGVVPNKENFSRGDNVLKVYKTIIETALKNNKVVYILRHSHDDKEACSIIKDAFRENENVKLINDDISSIEFDMIVENLELIIGSRFHSIVHAYKKSVPVIGIGWATKYHELLARFDQSRYMFDVRKDIDLDEVESNTKYMLSNLEEESEKIENKLIEIQSSIDLFSVFK